MQVDVVVGVYGPAVDLGGGRLHVSYGLLYGHRSREASTKP